MYWQLHTVLFRDLCIPINEVDYRWFQFSRILSEKNLYKTKKKTHQSREFIRLISYVLSIIFKTTLNVSCNNAKSRLLVSRLAIDSVILLERKQSRSVEFEIFKRIFCRISLKQKIYSNRFDLISY